MALRESPDDTYQCGPGLCVIINNLDSDVLESDNDQEFTDLPGKIDETNLMSAFSSLGFKVKPHRNLTAAEIKSIAQEYSKKEHTGAFFLIISSHGDEGVVCGTDNRDVKVCDLQKYFHATNCPSLAGKPKVFLIDACRGSEREQGLVLKQGPNDSNINTITVTDSADFMTIFASPPGNVAAAYYNHGSILIQTFVEALQECSPDENLTDTMKWVNRKNQDIEVHGKKIQQTSQIVSTFTRHYFIKRNKSEPEPKEQIEQNIKKLSLEN